MDNDYALVGYLLYFDVVINCLSSLHAKRKQLLKCNNLEGNIFLLLRNKCSFVQHYTYVGVHVYRL